MTDTDRAREILSCLHSLFKPGQVIEIRAISGEGISSGYFNDYEKATSEMLQREADIYVSGIYATLNEVNPALLARRANRIKYRLEKKDASTADADIIRRRWLPIDIDPVRPSGVSSSDEEHAAALALAHTIAAFLSGHDWPEPLVADSGNGAHLLYPIDLPNDDQSKILVRQVLQLLDIRFSNARCKVDTANFNAARIWKVYGTISRKGDNLPDRPHRRSKLITSPQITVPLDPLTIGRLLSWYPAAPDGGRREGMKAPTSEAKAAIGEHVLDLAKWLNRFNLTYTAKPYQGGTLFVLDACPFSDAHTDGAFAIQFANGAIFAGCHHDSCGSGKQRWPELRGRFDPPKADAGERLKKIRSDRIRAKHEAEGPLTKEDLLACEVPPEGSDLDDSEAVDTIAIASGEILSHGDPVAFMLETFSKRHEGDSQVAQCLIHSLISRIVLNSKGLHVSISGESGKGKSHAMDTMGTLIPSEYRIEGRVSDKALFYMDDLKPGTVITLDDVSLSDQMQEVLKGVTTSFQKAFPYRTVNKDRKPQICIIPERCVWWIAKVEGAGDDQVFNRMLTCWIDDTEEQDQKVLYRTLAQAGDLPDLSGDMSEDVLICKRMWEDISPVWVVIPYAAQIRFQSAENRRNPDMLLDLIRTHTAIFQHQRESRIVNGVFCVVATTEDFDHAATLFVALNGVTGGQETKLTRREAGLIAKLALYGHVEVTIAQIQQVSGWTSSSISKLLHGYRSYGKTYSGILDKCPAVSFLDRTVTKGDEGKTTMRRTTVYQWDPDIYKAWVKGSGVWLEKEDESDGPPDFADGDDHQQGGQVPTTFEDLLPVSEDLQNDKCTVSATSSLGCSLVSIVPRDFIEIEGFPEHKSCSVCGKVQVQYRERRSGTDKKDKKGSDPGMRVLCRSCYNRAVSREVASLVVLPGLIDTGAMVHREINIGTCDVCRINPAVWSDPISRTKICDCCYEREKGKTETQKDEIPSGCCRYGVDEE